MRVSARVGPRPEGSGPSATTGSLALPVAAGKRSSQRSRGPVETATGSARLPVVALGPEPSGLGPTRALTRIHAGAPAQLGRPPFRRPYRGQKRNKKACGGDLLELNSNYRSNRAHLEHLTAINRPFSLSHLSQAVQGEDDIGARRAPPLM
ncbi:hypothetical protein NDU88_003477 [Pleurodeles waltl]|uniref:Uncharacterized protein n=1 Tax=Pleurodeles waltl TaxID=8319 RepID=A0AAV7W2H2_PLEWA|nr:hypothetical protein NDU88_003477 [Pleurodeles waltl]